MHAAVAAAAAADTKAIAGRGAWNGLRSAPQKFQL